jgi:Domain of unknown function (DUF4912)
MLSKPRKVQKSKCENFEEIAFVRQHHTWRFSKLHDHVKMVETKGNRNAQALKTSGGFRISKKPVVHITAAEERQDSPDTVGLPREHGARILFAIARDPRTIFASWNIDWPALFEKVVPVDRQVHLRLHRADGLEEKTVAVEPLAAMHYLTTSGTPASYRVEIGYYAPADVWQSVAMSHEIVTPPDDIAEAADVDLATIPFHIGFQQLLDLFGISNGTALANVISDFQKRVMTAEKPEDLSPHEQEILRKLDLSLSEVASAWRGFEQIDREKLAKRTGVLTGFSATSPSGRREADWISAGS